VVRGRAVIEARRRARLVRAAVGFALVPPTELKVLHRWLDCWRCVGDVVTGMKRALRRRALRDPGGVRAAHVRQRPPRHARVPAPPGAAVMERSTATEVDRLLQELHAPTALTDEVLVASVLNVLGQVAADLTKIIEDADTGEQAFARLAAVDIAALFYRCATAFASVRRLRELRSGEEDFMKLPHERRPASPRPLVHKRRRSRSSQSRTPIVQ